MKAKNDENEPKGSCQNYSNGFFNLIYLLLILAFIHLILKNGTFRALNLALEYGFCPIALFHYLCLLCFVTFSLFLEKLYIFYLKQYKSSTELKVTNLEENLFTLIFSIHLLLLLSVPLVTNKLHPSNPYLISFICNLYLATCLKLYSYHQVNSWWRSGKIYGKNIASESELISQEKLSEKYPDNVTLSNIFYFILSPTLCYQMSFLRVTSRNYILIFRCLLEIIILTEVLTYMIQQWIMLPLESTAHFSEISILELILKWTRLSFGTITCWLLGFYLLFQSSLNLNAEILRFENREFYLDWWNAKSFSEFWRNWNIPVHRWCVQHLYKPLVIQCGLSRTKASFAIFFASGLLHEYFASISLRMVCVHFLVGMTAQQPLDMITAEVHQKYGVRLANCLIWLSLIVGQSALALLYHNDWLVSQLFK